MANARFIEYDYVVQNHPMFNGNIERNTIDATILLSQKQYIRNILGTNLYNAIVTQIVNSGSPQGNYQTLVDEYVAPALVQWVAFKSVPYLSSRITNKGIVESSSDYSSPVSMDKLQMLQSEFKDSAGILTQLLADYLTQYESLFPELSTNNGLDEKNPSKIGFQIPIYSKRRSRLGNCGCGSVDSCNCGPYFNR